MRTFAQKQNATQQTRSTNSDRTHSRQSRELNSILYLQRTIENQAGQRSSEANVEDDKGDSSTGIARFGHDFTRIQVYSKAPLDTQAKLTVNTPGDEYEQEADRVAGRVMSMSPSGDSVGSAPPGVVQRQSIRDGREDLGGAADGQREDEEGEADIGGSEHGSAVASLPSLGVGSPLPASERKFMEPRFGYSFADVRVHTNSRANAMASSLGARAFTSGNDIVFGHGEWTGSSGGDRRLLAHELTHVIQQRGGDRQGMISSADPNIIRRYLAGPPQRVGLTTTTAPTYGNCRNFNTVISWNTDLRNGFIIQECINGDSITRCADGQAVAAPNTPHYWEAWEVDAAGNISDGNADTWFRGGRPGTSGWWTFDSNVFAHSGPLDPAWGFSRNSVGTAGSLLASTTGPNRDQLYQPSMTRHHGGTWDCCNGKNTHVPR